MPVFNVGAYVDERLASIVAQSCFDLQIIAVDDGSTDGLGLRCDVWAAYDSRIEVIHQRNRGLSVARNIGIDRVLGDYLVFVDPDNYVQDRFVEELLAVVLCTDADCTSASDDAVDPR